MKRFAIFCLCLLIFPILFSCGNKKGDSKTKKSAAADFSDEMNEPEKNWSNADGVICIIFGYGFNDPQFYVKAIEKLNSVYGLDENGGLILPMIFPDDFKNGIQDGLQQTFEEVRKYSNIKSIIILGAPDKTCDALANLQDRMFNGTYPFPIISLFPQDDPFGQEATCSLIIDYERSLVEDQTDNELQLKTNIDAEQIFASTVKFMANLDGELIKGKNEDAGKVLKEIVQKIVGDDKNVHRYVDRGSGMQSLNHYTVESR